MHSIHLAIPAMHLWIYIYGREIGSEIAINCFHGLFSNQSIDFSKIPNKEIFIEKLQSIVHQPTFSNLWW